MAKKKGKTIFGFRSKSKNKKPNKKRCEFGVNKNTGKCLKHPRRKN